MYFNNDTFHVAQKGQKIFGLLLPENLQPKIAQYFKTHGIYPNGKIGIGRFLKNKRKSFKQHTNGTKSKLKYTWYPSDREVAKAHGLPNDWMLVIDFEKESNQRNILFY